MKFNAFILFLLIACCIFSQSTQSQAQEPTRNNNPPTNDEAHAPRSSDSLPSKNAIDGNQKAENSNPQGDPKPIPYTPTEKLTAVLIFITGLQALIYFFQWLWMVKTLNHSRESSQKGLRAYIGLIYQTDPEDSLNLKGVFPLKIINSGQTPAYAVNSVFSWRWFAGNNVALPKPDLDSIPVGSPSMFTLIPKQDIPLSHPIAPSADGITLKECVERSTKNEEITIYLYGRVKYVDVFREDHFTCFCYVHNRGTTNKWNIYRDYNENT